MCIRDRCNNLPQSDTVFIPRKILRRTREHQHKHNQNIDISQLVAKYHDIASVRAMFGISPNDTSSKIFSRQATGRGKTKPAEMRTDENTVTLRKARRECKLPESSTYSPIANTVSDTSRSWRKTRKANRLKMKDMDTEIKDVPQDGDSAGPIKTKTSDPGDFCF